MSDDTSNSSNGGTSAQGVKPTIRATSRTSDETDVSSAAAATKFEAARKLRLVQGKLSEAQDNLKLKYRIAADTTDDFVHDNPWKAITMAALAGLVIGMLAAR
jgi:ElaB/YqjD/DUF883 family membrane-anchored ribosome-binding protein